MMIGGWTLTGNRFGCFIRDYILTRYYFKALLELKCKSRKLLIKQYKKSRHVQLTCGIVKLALISGQYTNRMLSTHNTLPGQPVNAF